MTKNITMVTGVIIEEFQNFSCRREGAFVLDKNDTEFLCCQKWVAWLPMLLFTHYIKMDKNSSLSSNANGP